MENSVKIATAQFEHRSGHKRYNLSVIDALSKKAAAEGANAICFHECSVTGYTFARRLSKQEMLDIAEFIPGGNSTDELIAIAKKYNIAVLAGLFEKDNNDNLFKAFVCG